MRKGVREKKYVSDVLEHNNFSEWSSEGNVLKSD